MPDDVKSEITKLAEKLIYLTSGLCPPTIDADGETIKIAQRLLELGK